MLRRGWNLRCLLSRYYGDEGRSMIVERVAVLPEVVPLQRMDGEDITLQLRKGDIGSVEEVFVRCFVWWGVRSGAALRASNLGGRLPKNTSSRSASVSKSKSDTSSRNDEQTLFPRRINLLRSAPSVSCCHLATFSGNDVPSASIEAARCACSAITRGLRGVFGRPTLGTRPEKVFHQKKCPLSAKLKTMTYHHWRASHTTLYHPRHICGLQKEIKGLNRYVR